MKIAIIFGTRPEIMKISPVIEGCEKQGIDFCILHTGQHYSYEIDRVFFEQLKLPEAKYNLDVGSCKHGGHNAKMFIGIEENPDERQARRSPCPGRHKHSHCRGSCCFQTPAHSITVIMIGKFGLKVSEGTRLTEPLGYFEFLEFENRARFILTSGGMQEEDCILKIPCVTLRDNIEIS